MKGIKDNNFDPEENVEENLMLYHIMSNINLCRDSDVVMSGMLNHLNSEINLAEKILSILKFEDPNIVNQLNAIKKFSQGFEHTYCLDYLNNSCNFSGFNSRRTSSSSLPSTQNKCVKEMENVSPITTSFSENKKQQDQPPKGNSENMKINSLIDLFINNFEGFGKNKIGGKHYFNFFLFF